GNLGNKADEALAHFTEPVDVKGTEEDGKDHENKNQSSSDASEDRDLDNVSDSEKEGKKEKNYPPQMFSPQQDEILATVTFGESEGSSTGKITLWGKPDSAESISLATGKITAEVKYGSFNVKVEIENVSLFDSETKLIAEKRKSSNNKCCHERHQKSQCSNCSKYQCSSTDHSAEHNGNYKGSSKHKIQSAINKNASLKINIEANEIKVEYINRKKNVKVNIKPGEQAQSKTCNREHEDTYWIETDCSVTEAPCNTDCESSFSFYEKVDYTFPDECTLLPPPKEFADCDKMHLDTIAEGVSSYPVNDRKESDSLSTTLRIWGEENYFHKHSKKDYEDHTSEKEDFSKDKILFSKINSTNYLVASNTLNNPNTGKEYFSKNNELGQERNTCDKWKDTELKPARRKSFPDTTLDVPSLVHPRRDSGFYSLPSLKVLPKETKAGDAYNRNSHVHISYTELSKCPDLTSSLRSLRDLKSSYQYAFTSFDHNITIYPSEPEESLDGTCLLNDYVGQGEETEETLRESLRSSGAINEKKEHGHEEPLGNLAIWEEDSESTEDASDEGTPEYNHLEKHTELQNKAQLVDISPHSRSSLGEIHNDEESANNLSYAFLTMSGYNLDLKSEMNKTRKLPLMKDTRASDSSQEEAVDQWARRRKQFKDSKKCSSTGGSSINSTITEGSINSEDARSVDLRLHSENEDRGFYSENFHSASWVFRGDDVSPDNSPRCLSKRPRPVAIRERTVKITKGTGNYPWGFRIQFSKPILVTEVDTNSAAEEAGLQVGDILIAVNGTDVTSMPHSEAANLARKGPDILTMVVGSDISRYPNTPRPTCRGYLHKRTQSAILKGWRKRWFVLKHNGYLHYYKHKKDEGKCRPLEVTKLEGAEIGVDTSLGKPFVFKCVPQTGSRIFYFCATSNQEMKRWLEAMDKAVHPVHQNHVWVDVTLHNTTLPPLAIKNPECLGLLHQLDRSKDVWIQHYCILKDGCLYFYATLRSTPAQGGLYLQGYVVSEQPLGSKRSVIELKPPSEEFKTFYLSAENVNENKRWITALKASINKWLPLHQAIQDFMNRPLEETRM
uniref:PKHA5 protein n=1 Tax=Strix occidentalis caurina TaxID=311401 RepID=A0A8D0FQB3_STROC